MSEEMLQSLPNISLIILTLSRYHSREYPRFIMSKMRLFPLWTGRWIDLQMLSYLAITRSTSAVISLGWEVEKRIRSFGDTCATISNKLAKLTMLDALFFSIQALLFSSADHL